MSSLVPFMSVAIDYMVQTFLITVSQVKRRHEQKRLLRLARILMDQCPEQRDMVDNMKQVPVKYLPKVYETMCHGEEECFHWFRQLGFLAYLDRRYKLSTQEWNDIWDLMSKNRQFQELSRLGR